MLRNIKVKLYKLIIKPLSEFDTELLILYLLSDKYNKV